MDAQFIENLDKLAGQNNWRDITALIERIPETGRVP
jgi:hypothetical protein